MDGSLANQGIPWRHDFVHNARRYGLASLAVCLLTATLSCASLGARASSRVAHAPDDPLRSRPLVAALLDTRAILGVYTLDLARDTARQVTVDREPGQYLGHPTTVLLEDGPVALTAREYALVEYLAVHRGRVVTRTTLYDHLFDENELSLSNLLDVHVSNVRKKLGQDFIQTRRGHGYIIL